MREGQVKKRRTSRNDQRRELAILFVHGIGEQQRGETLESFGQPLIGFLRDLGDEGAPSINLRAASGNFGRKPEIAADGFHRRGEPIWAEYELGASDAQQDGVARPTERWLLAESNWANAFVPPRPTAVARWSLRVLPLLILVEYLSFIGSRAETSAVPNPRSAVAPVSALGALLAAYLHLWLRLLTFACAALLIPLLYAMCALPLTSRLRAATRLRDIVTAYIGDAYVVTTSIEARDRIAGQISKDVVWCLGQAKRVLVIAHSQGAMLCRQAMKDPRCREASLIGVGSGLALLHALSREEQRRGTLYAWVVMGMLGVGLTVGCAVGFAVLSTLPDDVAAISTLLRRVLLPPPDQSWGIEGSDFVRASSSALYHGLVDLFEGSWRRTPVLAVGMVGLLLLVQHLAQRATGISKVFESLPLAARQTSDRFRRWVEVSSPYDVVSCGSVLELCADEVHSDFANSTSIPREHIEYFANRRLWIVVTREIDALLGRMHPWASEDRLASIERDVRVVENLRRASQQRQMKILIAIVAGVLLLLVTVFQQLFLSVCALSPRC